MFSHWYQWENREDYKLCKYPGIYSIDITNKNLLDKKFKFSKDVVYIGMTNSKGGLCARWQQFNNSIKGGEGHGPAKRIYSEKGHCKDWTEKLYISAMGIKRDDSPNKPDYYIRRGWIAFLEQEALAKFHQKVNKHPKYNKQ